MNISYKEGWNLVSTPIEQSVNNLLNVIDNTLYEYEIKRKIILNCTIKKSR